MSHPPPGGTAAPAPGTSRPPTPSAWSPSVRSAAYLPRAALSRPGPWHLPQVRAQALQALIDDVAGWARNIHGLLVVLLGAAGAGTVILATSAVATGWVSWLLIGTASVAFLAWAVWGVWLECSAWRAIAATGRWHAAYVRGTGASGQVSTPSVADVFTPALITRLLVALGLFAAAGWAAWPVIDAQALRSGQNVGYLALAAVLAVSALSVLMAFIGLLLAFGRQPSAQAQARARAAPAPAAPGAAGTGEGRAAGAPSAGAAPHRAAAPPPSAYAPPQSHPSMQTAPGVAGPPRPPPPASHLPSAPAPSSAASVPPTDEVEATRLAARLGPLPAETSGATGVRVLLADGRQVTAGASTLIGRDPSAREGEVVEALLRVDDQSVSKTHVCLRVSGERVWAIDRASTNGTLLRGPDGTETELEPWQETAVPVGSTLRLGGTEITVALEPER